MKLLKKITNLSSSNVKKIPLTIILLVLTSILFIVDIFENSNIITYIKSLFILLIFTIFFVEVAFSNKRKRLIGYILSIIFVLILNHCSLYHIFLKCCIQSDFNLYMEYILCAYVIFISSLSIYIIFRKSKLKFYEYVNIVFSNIFKVLIVYTISSFGILFILILCDDLISSFEDFTEISRVLYTLLSMLYLLSNVIISLIDTDDKKVTNLFKGISLYCFFPITIISILVIYFHIISILVTKNIPNNFIFMYVSVIFIMGLVCYLILKNYNYKLTKIYNNVFAYLYILPVIIQIYSINIRFKEYGLTPLRYLSYMFIIFEVITLILIIYKKGIKIENILISIMILSIMSTMTPFNLVRLSNLNQQKILNENYNKEGEDFQRAVSAYKYLNGSIYGNKYISKEIDRKLLPYISDKRVTKNYKTYSYVNNNSNIDIGGYNNLELVKFTYDSKGDDINRIFIKNQKTNGIFRHIDIEKYVNDIVSKIDKEEIKKYKDEIFSNNNEIIIDEYNKLYFTYFYVKYDDDKILYINARAYLLQKIDRK